MLDRAFTDEKLKVEDYPARYEEQASFAPDAAQLAALRKLPEAKSVSVRLTGEKGYVMLSKEDAAALRADIITALLMLAKLRRHRQLHSGRLQWMTAPS